MIQKIALRDGLHLEDYAGLALWFTILSRWARGRSSSGAPASAASGAATSGWTVAPSPPTWFATWTALAAATGGHCMRRAS